MAKKKELDVTQIEIPIPETLTPEEREAVADEVIEYIVDRTKRGLDKNGKKFVPYSDGYAASLAMQIAKHHGGKSPKKVTLELSGDMLAALSRIRIRRDAIVVGYKASDPIEKGKAEGNITGSYGQSSGDESRARDFLGITPQALNSILAKYGK